MVAASGGGGGGGGGGVVQYRTTEAVQRLPLHHSHSPSHETRLGATTD